MLPQISKELSKSISNTGGWLVGLSNDLLKQENIEMTVVFPNKNEYINGKIGNLKYYGFSGKSNKQDFENILEKENPDIIHIFGTEYKHTLDMVNVCEQLDLLDKTVINIQGLTSVIATHYNANLSSRTINGYTFRDFIKQDNIRLAKKSFAKRGKHEIEALKKARHCIGRTDWDKACTEQINPNIKYHFCNETLRDEFYKHIWDIEKCEKHSIFLSQCNYPIKGFHFMLEAMPEILKRYPNARIYTTGKNPLTLSGIDKIKQGSYSKYLGKLMKKYLLENKVSFLGGLNEEQMCERFLKSHVFVAASTIENSPNSVGESMILGVPVVTSDVGGVKNMITHDKEGFIYQHDAPYMIVHYVCRVFDDDKLASQFSRNAQEHAKITHNREVNLQTMLSIYKGIGRI